MPIQSQNLRLLRAATADDSPLNGGLPSAVVIEDGASNGIFPDVSGADRSTGRVQFRKVYLSVDTDDTSVLQGAHTFISEVPADPATSLVLFAAANAAETQGDMVSRVGLAGGELSASQIDSVSNEMYLLGQMPAGTDLGTSTAYVGGLSYLDWGVIGSGGAMVFAVTMALAGVVDSHFSAGQVLTLVEFYGGQVARVEPREILRFALIGGVPFGGVTNVMIEFTTPSAYAAVWGAGNQFFDSIPGGAGKRFGTYVIEGDAGIALKRFEYYGAAVSTAPLATGATAIPVDAVTTGVVPELLAADPYADEVLGYSPALLSRDPAGREPIFRAYRRVVIGKPLTWTGVVAAGQTVSLGELNVSWVRIRGANGTEITAGADADLDAGTVTFSDVSGYSQPVTITSRAEDLVQLIGVSGLTLQIAPSRPLQRAYPAGSTVSAAIMHGDRRARVVAVNARQSWLGSWADTLDGSSVSAAFDTVNHPIAVTNAGTVSDRVRISFTGTTAFSAYSENFGQLSPGSTGAVYAPLNPSNGKPLFSIPAAGWGGGWAAGNQLLLELDGAQPALWVLRCVQVSPDTLAPATFELSNGGYVNRLP